MSKTLKEIAIEMGQDCLKAMPVIVLGSGASVPHGLPTMKNLAEHLAETPPLTSQSTDKSDQWSQFVTILNKGIDLESALNELDIDDDVWNHIVSLTWEFVCEHDASLFEGLVTSAHVLPLSDLYHNMFISSNKRISVVTTNYDRLAEYAADFAGYRSNVGFTVGYHRRLSSPNISRLSRIRNAERIVDVWKVHGCLDWFLDPDGVVNAVYAARKIPKGLTPAIITPGTKKYERAYLEPFRTVINHADEALTNASAYLCIGFGFNDQHIVPKLIQRWKRDNVLMVILAKELTPSTRKMIAQANGVRYMALEQSDYGTALWTHELEEPMILNDIDLWDLATFLAETT